jgi:hypothetical protein
MATTPHPVAGHETRDARVRPIILMLFVLLIGAGICAFIVYGVFWYLADHPPRTGPVNPMALATHEQMAAPRLDDHPAAELQDILSYEESILNTYGWTDKQAGIVRIPIQKAMDLELQKGFPTKPSSSQPASKSGGK